MSLNLARPRRWLWVVLFILLVTILVVLAAGWNVVLVRDYRRIVELAGSAAWSTRMTGMIYGTLGFIAVLLMSILFLVRLLREMKLTQFQSEFLAHATHELKTPLATLELSSDLLARSTLSEEERTRLWQSHAIELRRLRRDVEGLLEAARIESGISLPMERQTLDFEQWLSSRWSHWQNLLGFESKFTRQGTPLHFDLTVNPKSLELVFDNLLENSKKFSKGPAIVRIVTSREGNQWALHIEDEGLGFLPKDAKRIFGRFYRSPQATLKPVAGNGLGLHIAKAACRKEGLSIRAQSAGPNCGARFTLRGKVDPQP